jgi:hypothetical protein
MAFTLTYTTSGFSSPLSLGLIGDLGAFDMSADNCVIGYQANQFPIVSSGAALSAGQTFKGDFFIIVSNFFSPAQPGDPQVLQRQDNCLRALVSFANLAGPGEGGAMTGSSLAGQPDKGPIFGVVPSSSC